MKTEKLSKIISLIKECYNKPSILTAITINDGKLIKINLNNDQLQISLRIIDIEKNTNEFELIQEIKEFLNVIIDTDAILQYYLGDFLD